ncbi:CHAT domain-containing protein [Fodinibius sediminis]|uniref:CHAT domain-containing protein n=1 Tax=Fodinibius sediminis TaxID=1214077 RepID=A0A521BHQ6_9BACT|nr:CHAT domain-containing tetratricopeptide repeat protein [Fodinibius sediminis]SMO46596.1 CHAT domain-containing protein [Fodinibius sediminis]
MYKCWLIIILAGWCLPVTGHAQNLEPADSLFQKGRQFDDSGRMVQAEFYYRQAYNLYRNGQDTTGWLEAGKEYASAMVTQLKYERAMKLYQYLLEINHPDNDTYNRGDLYNSMGWASNRLGKSDLALNYYEKSLPLAQKSGDAELIGVVLDNIGSAYRRKGNFSKALSYRERALPHLQKLDNKLPLSIGLSNIGDLYEVLMLYSKALDYYNRSLELAKPLGNVDRLAIVYSQIAGIQEQLGNFDQSLIAYHKSLDYARKSGRPKRVQTILNDLGLLYKNLGEYEKAIAFYRQSLEISKKREQLQSIATTTMNIGKALWELDRKEEAADYYLKSYKLRKKVGNSYKMSFSLNTMIELELYKKDYGRARMYARRLRTIGDSINNHSILENAASYFGRIHAAEEEDREALEYFQKAYNHSRHSPEENRFTALHNLAKQHDKMNSDSAVVYGQQAVDIIERYRSNAGASSTLKRGYFKKYSGFYTQLASWVLEYEQDTSRAFRLVEQAKARSLRDELANASRSIQQNLPVEIQENRKKKQVAIDSLYNQLEVVSGKEEQEQLKSALRTAELDYAAYENSLRTQFPRLKNMNQPEPISLEKAQAITGTETAVLEYAITEDELIAFLISRDKVHVKQYSLAEKTAVDKQLNTQIAAFRDGILSNASRSQLKKSSDKLYAILIEPFEQLLAGYSNLIIVPDGVLAHLPFEALMQGNRYLIEKFRIKYEPSITSLTLLNPPGESVDQKKMLAVAGSQFAKNAKERPSNTSRLSSLPSTTLEVDSIVSHFEQVKTLKEEQVSEQAVKSLLANNSYQYVHLATHGIIDEKRPHRSGLALSSGNYITASSEEDGLLRSSEIFGLNIDSDMVVLSACNTGLGKVVEGEGMLGMQRSFFYAGASTVVVSLWNVYDRSTSSLMNLFYKALMADEAAESWSDRFLRWIGWDISLPFGKKANAMRKAKMRMINHPLYNHPVYWAPFIVVGR